MTAKRVTSEPGLMVPLLSTCLTSHLQGIYQKAQKPQSLDQTRHNT